MVLHRTYDYLIQGWYGSLTHLCVKRNGNFQISYNVFFKKGRLSYTLFFKLFKQQLNVIAQKYQRVICNVDEIDFQKATKNVSTMSQILINFHYKSKTINYVI